MKTKTSINTPIEELVPNTDIEEHDINKVQTLDELGSVAQKNTRSILVLQRARNERKSAGLPFDDIEKLLRTRQSRSANLIRRRQAMQVESLKQEKEKVLNEEMNSGSASLNAERKLIVDRLVKLLDKAKRSRQIAQNADQRRIAAKMRGYEDGIVNALHFLDRLSNLEQVDAGDI